MTETASRPPRKTSVSLRNNPVLRREMVERLQGFSGVILLTLPLLLLVGVLALAYSANAAVNQAFVVDVTELGRVGRGVFEWVLSAMMGLLLFIVPGLTAGSITGERERQTLVPLQMTMMSPFNIVLGKLSAALAFLVLLIVASIPLLSVSYLVGGLAVLDIFRGLFMVLFTGVVLGSICIFVSSRMKRTATSTVVCYGISFIFSFGGLALLAVWAIVGAILNDFNGEVVPPGELLSVNAFAALADALPRSAGNFGSDTESPLGASRSLVRELAQENFDGGDFDPDNEGAMIWPLYIGIGFFLFVVSIRGAIKSVTTPARTER